MMNINETLLIPGFSCPGSPDRLISFILSLRGKIAHARKSGIGKGEIGCGCEGETVHGGHLTGNGCAYYMPFPGERQQKFLVGRWVYPQGGGGSGKGEGRGPGG